MEKDTRPIPVRVRNAESGRFEKSGQLVEAGVLFPIEEDGNEENEENEEKEVDDFSSHVIKRAVNVSPKIL